MLITRQDLSPGYQCVQPAHALAMFSQAYPEIFKAWYTIGQNLVVVSTTNEKQLNKLAEKFKSKGLNHVIFREPDIGNEVTAVAVEPHGEAYKLVSSLPLTLKGLK